MTKKEWVTDLQARLQGHASESKRDWWVRYLRGTASFRGVSMADVRAELHDWYRVHGLAEGSRQKQAGLALELIRQDHTEDKLAGMLLLGEVLMPTANPGCADLLPGFAGLFEEGHLADWNSVDWFCVKVLGPLVERDGEPCARAIGEWRRSTSLWQRRASAVAFVNVVRQGDLFPGFLRMVLESCEELVQSSERFSQTGAGWVLREVSHVAPAQVESFVRKHVADLSREALSSSTKKLSLDVREELMRMHRPRSRTVGDGGAGPKEATRRA